MPYFEHCYAFYVYLAYIQYILTVAILAISTLLYESFLITPCCTGLPNCTIDPTSSTCGTGWGSISESTRISSYLHNIAKTIDKY